MKSEISLFTLAINLFLTSFIHQNYILEVVFFGKKNPPLQVLGRMLFQLSPPTSIQNLFQNFNSDHIYSFLKRKKSPDNRQGIFKIN
jgi:hypothetical protein